MDYVEVIVRMGKNVSIVMATGAATGRSAGGTLVVISVTVGFCSNASSVF